MISSYDLIKATGITYRQLDHWTRVGYLHTTGDPEPGSGMHRQYPSTEVNIARLMRQLIAAGLSPKAAHVAASQLTISGSAELGDYVLTPKEHTHA